MKVTSILNGDEWVFSVATEPADEQLIGKRSAKIHNRTFMFKVSESFNREEIHADVEATIAYLIFGFWCGENFVVERPVSSHFSQAFSTIGKTISPVDPNLNPRKVSDAPKVHGLAFSGGVDSCAALWCMPKESTLAVFMNNVSTERRQYKGDSALASCSKIRDLGYDVLTVDTTFESVRKPHGFPCDWSVFVGLLLASGRYNIASVNCGMVLESAYRIGLSFFSDLKERSIYYSWTPLLDAIEMPLSAPVCSISEYLTSKIALNYCADWGAESCVRGEADRPCGKCVKCFRKGIINAKAQGTPLPKGYYEEKVVYPEVDYYLKGNPMKHEDVLAYCLQGNAPHEPCEIYEGIKKKTESRSERSLQYSFLARYLPQALEYTHPDLREHVKAQIEKIAEPMSQAEVSFLESWDVR